METNNKLEPCNIGIYDSSECQKSSTFYSGESCLKLISDFSLPDQELIKRRSGLSTLSVESNICTHHEALILTKFEFLQKNCCNLLRKQNHSNIKGLHPIDLPTADLKAITKHEFKPGQKLSPRCRQDLCVKLQDPSSPKSDSDSDDPTNASENLSASFSPLVISPLKIQRISKQNSLSYAKHKLSEAPNAIADQIAVIDDLTPANIKAEPESGQCKRCSDCDLLLTELKQKLELSSNREKIQILTLAPHSWTVEKTALEFGVSTRMVKKARKLKQQDGILAVPVTKRGKVLAQQITQKVLDFYEDNEISRICPGEKDYVSVWISGEKVQKQKRLLLCNLKELYTTYCSQHGPEIRFSKFCEL
nr:ARL14 effector protein-like isoform X2 [Geotrypetes seraphini]XP_033816332.1 ARL14 effector protein-like isoform X2 [Geotrypetes seraphini]